MSTKNGAHRGARSAIAWCVEGPVMDDGHADSWSQLYRVVEACSFASVSTGHHCYRDTAIH
jgi:hypothetical protein